MSKRRRGLELPNYTQTPNLIFDELLPVMSNAELRVTLVIVRSTLGWQVRTTDEPLPLSEIARLGGLSLRSAKTGAQEGVERGLLVRYPCLDEGGRKTFKYGLNFQGERSQLYRVIERPKAGGTGAKFALVFKRVFKYIPGAKFALGMVQILHRTPEGLSVQKLPRSYKEQRNLLVLKKERRKKAAVGEEIQDQRDASSSEKDLAVPAEQTGATPDHTQAPGVQAAADLPSQDESVQVAGEEGEDWPEGLEEVPGERENIHEGEQSESAAAPAHDAAAVNARLNQLCNGRWLSPPKGTTDPAWIDEVGSAGLDRHQIAEVVTLDRLEAFRREAMEERVDMQVQNVTPVPQVCTLVIRKCEAHLSQHLQRQALAERAAQQPQASQQASSGARPVTSASQWAVDDQVTYCRDRYKVAEVGEGYILLDSKENGSVRINLTTSDALKVRLLSRPSLDIDEVGTSAASD